VLPRTGGCQLTNSVSPQLPLDLPSEFIKPRNLSFVQMWDGRPSCKIRFFSPLLRNAGPFCAIVSLGQEEMPSLVTGVEVSIIYLSDGDSPTGNSAVARFRYLKESDHGMQRQGTTLEARCQMKRDSLTAIRSFVDVADYESGFRWQEYRTGTSELEGTGEPGFQALTDIVCPFPRRGTTSSTIPTSHQGWDLVIMRRKRCCV
jgi:hypothetical protein